MKNKKKQKKKIIIVLIIGIIIVAGIFFLLPSSKESILIQDSNNNYLLINNKKQIKIKLKEINNIYKINNNYLLYLKDQKLYLYNVKKEKSKEIAKDNPQIHDFNINNIIYSINNNTYIYNIKKNKTSNLKDINYIEMTKDKKNIVGQNNNKLIIYNIKNNKEIVKINDVREYKCNNDSCTDIYYIESNNLKRYHKKVKDLKENAINILYQEKNIVIYQNYINGEYSLYYKKGNKNIKLDTSKRAFDKVLINKNKVIYQTAGNCIEIKKNGKKRKIIARDIDKLIEVYKNKYLILKNNSLYLNNKLLDKKVNKDSITIIKNKIYYLKSNDEIYELVKSTAKKSKIINKNVIDLKSIEDNIYYLGDYNLNYRYGNIYTIKGKNKIAEKVSTIIDNE